MGQGMGKGGKGRRTSEDDFLLAELVEMRLEICVREGAGLRFMYHLRVRIYLYAFLLKQNKALKPAYHEQENRSRRQK